MKTERDELFRELTPPEGGAARMRARLAAEVSNATKPRANRAAQPPAHDLPPSRASWHFAAAGVAAVLLIAVFAAVALLTGPSTDPGSIDGGIAAKDVPVRGELYASADLDRLLGRASTPLELSVSLGDERLDLTEIPTRDPQVRLVRIEGSAVN